jgi:two-component sensor histidine kinase
MADPDEARAERQLHRLRTQRAVLASFGGRALRGGDLDALLHEATRLVSQACDIELVKVLELLPGRDAMLVRAGVNWKPGVVGHLTFPAHTGSPSGYALQTGQPVISRDIATERRFEIPDVLIEHRVQSAVNVVIEGEHGPWGVLEVDARERRDFDDDDIAFLQTYANLLAAAVERAQAHAELAAAVERGRILQAELRHRGRNLLTNIRALAARTRASSTDLDGFGAAFEARLAALGRTQELLTPGSAESVGIRRILLQELEAHGAEVGDSVVLSGPELTLPAGAVQALALAVHELATNATKHGALGRESGRLTVSWWRLPGTDGDEIAICWRETGVAIAGPPERRGMGSETVERSLPYMLGGSAAMTFHPDGLECTIRFPEPGG